MKNLFILGSPRIHGNSHTMAIEVARGLAEFSDNEIDYIHLNTLAIRPCQGCGGCDKTGQCVIHDDMQQLYLLIAAADRIFFVSPIYFYSVSAQLKTFIDRCQAQWAWKYLLNSPSPKRQNRKSGHLLSCAATSGKTLFTGAESIIKCLCDTLDIDYAQPLLIKKVDTKSAIKNNPTRLEQCYLYGTQTAEGAI